MNAIPKIAIFASGAGSNAEKILEYARQTKAYEIVAAVSNNRESGFAQWALRNGIKLYFVGKGMRSCEKPIEEVLLEREGDLVVLAGFLQKIPKEMIEAFPQKIINIHRALLPKFGGIGMYGMHVHQAVKDAEEKESGISIHYIDQEYDKGPIILQKKIAILQEDTAADIAAKVQKLEHQFYAPTIASILLQKPLP